MAAQGLQICCTGLANYAAQGQHMDAQGQHMAARGWQVRCSCANVSNEARRMKFAEVTRMWVGHVCSKFARLHGKIEARQ